MKFVHWCATRDPSHGAHLHPRDRRADPRAGESRVTLCTCDCARQAVVYATGLPRLTPREIEILHLSAGGQSRKETAAALGMSRTAVSMRLQRMYTKLGAASLAHAVALGYDLGYLP